MFGVIARYALAAGESNYRRYGVGRLPVSHFLSIDSPQQFATIDWDLMDFLYSEPLRRTGLVEDYENLHYPESTYLVFGKSRNNDLSFNFTYSGNENNNEQWNYAQDNSSYSYTDVKTTRVRSKFDQILFDQSDGAYGTNHDEFPDYLTNPILDFIDDKFSADVTTLNNTWKNKANIIENISVNDENTLFVKSTSVDFNDLNYLKSYDNGKIEWK